MNRHLAGVLLLPAPAAACSVCFGPSKGAQGLFDGLWWGIIVLLSTTMILLGSLAWLLWKVETRRRCLEIKP
ncbi:MAG: hypothetical protein AAB036_05890 [Elusimicrobiota bacterium]